KAYPFAAHTIRGTGYLEHVPEPEATRAAITRLWLQVAREQRRAARAAALAAHYEKLAARQPASLRDLRTRMAALHRRTEERHRTSAQIQALHATRLRSWLSPSSTGGERPAITGALGVALGAPSVLVTLLDEKREVALSTASDVDARIARDAEFV